MYKFILTLLLFLTFTYNTTTFAFEVYLEYQEFGEAEIAFPGEMVAKFFVRGERGERVFLEHRVVQNTLVIPLGTGVLLQGEGDDAAANRIRVRYRTLPTLGAVAPPGEYGPLPQQDNPERITTDLVFTITRRDAGIVRVQNAVLAQGEHANELHIALLRAIEKLRQNRVLHPENHPDYLFFLDLFETRGLLHLLNAPQDQRLEAQAPPAPAAPMPINPQRIDLHMITPTTIMVAPQVEAHDSADSAPPVTARQDAPSASIANPHEAMPQRVAPPPVPVPDTNSTIVTPQEIAITATNPNQIVTRTRDRLSFLGAILQAADLLGNSGST